MKIGADSQIVQPDAVLIGRGLAGILGDNNGTGEEPHFAESFDETEDLGIIGKPGIHADFIPFDGRGADDKHNFRLILQLAEHFKFTVRFKTGKDTGGVIIVKKLTSELQVQLVAEHGNTLPDML